MIRRPRPKEDLPFANAPLLVWEEPGLSIEGFSRAAMQTYWRIPEWNVLLDHGHHPWEFSSTSNLALTHTHPDHVSGLLPYLSTRNLLGRSPPRIYLPATYVDRLKKVLGAWRSFTTDHLPCEIIGCEVGDAFPLGQRRFLVPFEVCHVMPSLGYQLVERRHKLRPEFGGWSGREIKAAREHGMQVTDEADVCVLAYCGDTTVDTLDRNPELYRAEILILEVTFIGDEVSPDDARRHGHIHLEDVLKRAVCFHNHLLVLSHFSTRWKPRYILAELERVLPDYLRERVVVWF